MASKRIGTKYNVYLHPSVYASIAGQTAEDIASGYDTSVRAKRHLTKWTRQGCEAAIILALGLEKLAYHVNPAPRA